MTPKLKITGKAKYVSTEQVRAFIHATAIVLSYHNQDRPWRISVELSRSLPRYVAGDCQVYSVTMDAVGVSRPSREEMKFAEIRLRHTLNPEAMLTTCVHEVIHAYMTFPKSTTEACTTRLCARIKPDVSRIAEILLSNTYQRAAFIAHTKIKYVATQGDFYDEAQNAKIGVKTKYKRAIA